VLTRPSTGQYPEQDKLRPYCHILKSILFITRKHAHILVDAWYKMLMSDVGLCIGPFEPEDCRGQGIKTLKSTENTGTKPCELR
jgi:hypothetical protein